MPLLGESEATLRSWNPQCGKGKDGRSDRWSEVTSGDCEGERGEHYLWVSRVRFVWGGIEGGKSAPSEVRQHRGPCQRIRLPMVTGADIGGELRLGSRLETERVYPWR